ncbi:hypothetical protein DERP_004247 [Dermatophagoides pteronyssinus]|uniref:Uncharacterized protein n=1 Tax=Dermatophagoides pteronyssinus TaxID=6956 RepID=A0ABQ8J8J1_DERPT|nr:hypothetical protein DERP_004247 [Dermatophagoides pteronyssinus]
MEKTEISFTCLYPTKKTVLLTPRRKVLRVRVTRIGNKKNRLYRVESNRFSIVDQQLHSNEIQSGGIDGVGTPAVSIKPGFS